MHIHSNISRLNICKYLKGKYLVAIFSSSAPHFSLHTMHCGSNNIMVLGCVSLCTWHMDSKPRQITISEWVNWDILWQIWGPRSTPCMAAATIHGNGLPWYQIHVFILAIFPNVYPWSIWMYVHLLSGCWLHDAFMIIMSPNDSPHVAYCLSPYVSTYNFFTDLRQSLRNSQNTRRRDHTMMNPELNISPVLDPKCDNFIPEINRISVNRLRLGSHHLRIETGRWVRIPRDERLCVCCGNIQSESHVLLTALYRNICATTWISTHNIYANCLNIRNEMMCFRPLLCTLFRLNWAKQTPLIMRRN